MREADKAYIAGFIDADGSIIIDRQKRSNAHHKQHFYYVPRMCIANRHKGLLDWINEQWGNTGSMTKRYLNRQHKNWCDAWQLKFSSKASYKYLKVILPYLRMKTRQAELVIEMGELKQGTRMLASTKMQQQFKLMTKDYEQKTKRYDEIYRLIKKLNITGQEYLVNNGVNSGKPKSEDMAILSQAAGTPAEGAETTGAVQSA